MDILNQILNAQKGSRDDKVENFKSLFAEEDNVACNAGSTLFAPDASKDLLRRLLDAAMAQCVSSDRIAVGLLDQELGSCEDGCEDGWLDGCKLGWLDEIGRAHV